MSETHVDWPAVLGRLTALEVLVGFLFVGQKDRIRRFDGADKLIREMWEKAVSNCSADIAPEALEALHRAFEEAHASVASLRGLVG